MEVLIVVGVIALIVAIYVISVYNSLVAHRNKVKDQWAQIDVQLKRRFDLIPNLIEVVKGYTKHEKETLESVIEARNSFQKASTPEEEIKANTELTKVVTKLFALAESYPDLKASDSFKELQNSLNETEDKVAYARQFYNDSVYIYNNKIEMFPSNLVANIFGFTKSNFLEVDEAERENVKVKF